MQIECSLNAQDIRKINKYQKSMIRKILKANTSFLLQLFMTLVFFLWVIWTVQFISNLSSDLRWLVLYTILVPVFIFAFFKWLGVRRYYQYVASVIPPNALDTITLTDNGLLIASSQSNQFVSWAQIKEIVELPDYIMFVFPLLNVIAIPKRSFPGNNEMESFINEANSKMNKAKIS